MAYRVGDAGLEPTTSTVWT